MHKDCSYCDLQY